MRKASIGCNETIEIKKEAERLLRLFFTATYNDTYEENTFRSWDGATAC